MDEVDGEPNDTLATGEATSAAHGGVSDDGFSAKNPLVDRVVWFLLWLTRRRCSVAVISTRCKALKTIDPITDVSDEAATTAVEVAWKLHELDRWRHAAVDEKVKWLFACVAILSTFVTGMFASAPSVPLLISGTIALVTLLAAGFLAVWYFGVKAYDYPEVAKVLAATSAKEAKVALLNDLAGVAEFNRKRCSFDVEVYLAIMRITAVGVIAVVASVAVRFTTPPGDAVIARLRGDKNLIRELRGPQGETGPEGKRGPPGQKGEPGACRCPDQAP